jgi:hypothetical protein
MTTSLEIVSSGLSDIALGYANGFVASLGAFGAG